MSIKFEWTYHKSESKAGIARYKVGEKHHVLECESYNAAAKVHELLLLAHSTGADKASRENELESQRVRDILSIGA
jgi:hypothetical protein